MSFLQNLLQNSKSLKKTDTVVTQIDGTRYIEKHSSLTRIPQPQSVGYVIDNKPDDTPALVLPHLYIGSQDCCSPEVVQKHKFNLIMSIGIEPPHKIIGVTYRYVECLDLPETNLTQIILECNSIINIALYAGQTVLVPCNAGVSRSAAVVIGYLMLEMGLPYEDAYQKVKAVRSAIQPNRGFVQQLKKLEKVQ